MDWWWFCWADTEIGPVHDEGGGETSLLASAKYRVQIPRNWLKYTTGICIRIGVLRRSAKVSARYASSISTSMIQLHPCKWKRNRNRIRSKTVSGTDAPGAKEIAGSRQNQISAENNQVKTSQDRVATPCRESLRKETRWSCLGILQHFGDDTLFRSWKIEWFFINVRSHLGTGKIRAQEPALDTKCCCRLLLPLVVAVVSRTDQTTFQFYGLATANFCPALPWTPAVLLSHWFGGVGFIYFYKRINTASNQRSLLTLTDCWHTL